MLIRYALSEGKIAGNGKKRSRAGKTDCFKRSSAGVKPAPVFYLGCETTRRYGLRVFQPCGNFFLASSSETEGTMITSSPCCQFTGVATLCFAVNCNESMTLRISTKLRPVLAGYVIMSFTFRSGPMMKTDRTVNVSLAFG